MQSSGAPFEDFSGCGSSASSGGFDLEASMTFDMLSGDFNAKHGADAARPSSRATPNRRRQGQRRSIESDVSSGSMCIDDLSPALTAGGPSQLQTCREERSRTPSPPTSVPAYCGNSISLSAFASGSLRLDNISDEALRKLDTPNTDAEKKRSRKTKSLDKEGEEGTEATSVTSAASSFYETMTAGGLNESQNLMAALDLSVSGFAGDLREVHEQHEKEERKQEEEARQAVDRRAAFARMKGPIKSSLRPSQRHLWGAKAPSSRNVLEQTTSARVRWADKITDKIKGCLDKKRLSI